MRTKKRNVYYCEYCGKHSLMPLLKHEKHCTANPNRQCRMCDNACGDVPELIEKYKEQTKVETQYDCDEVFGNREWDEVKEKPKLADIMDDVEGCPACTLAIMRGCGLCHPMFDMKFDYKKEKDNFYTAINEYENYLEQQVQ